MNAGWETEGIRRMTSSLESLKLSLSTLQGGRGDLSDITGSGKTATGGRANTSTVSVTASQSRILSATPVQPSSRILPQSSSLASRPKVDSGDRSRTNTRTRDTLDLGAPVKFDPSAFLLASDDSEDEDTDGAKKADVVPAKPVAPSSGRAAVSGRKPSIADTPSMLSQKLDRSLNPALSVLRKPSESVSSTSGRCTIGQEERPARHEQCSSTTKKVLFGSSTSGRPSEQPYGYFSKSASTATGPVSSSQTSDLLKKQRPQTVVEPVQAKHTSPPSLLSTSSSLSSTYQSKVQPDHIPSAAPVSSTYESHAHGAVNREVQPPGPEHQMPMSKPPQHDQYVSRPPAQQSFGYAGPSPLSQQFVVNGRPYWVLSQVGKGACGKVCTVKEEIFVGENFVLFLAKPFVWNLISYFRDDHLLTLEHSRGG